MSLRGNLQITSVFSLELNPHAHVFDPHPNTHTFTLCSTTIAAHLYYMNSVQSTAQNLTLKQPMFPSMGNYYKSDSEINLKYAGTTC